MSDTETKYIILLMKPETTVALISMQLIFIRLHKKNLHRFIVLLQYFQVIYFLLDANFTQFRTFELKGKGMYILAYIRSD